MPELLQRRTRPVHKATGCSRRSGTSPPWGTPYSIERVDDRMFFICSAGPDKKVGTEDDIRVSKHRRR